MSRREEVKNKLISCRNVIDRGTLARTLADEVDAERAIVTKMLEVIKPTDEDDRLREFSNAACDRYGIKQRLYNRALQFRFACHTDHM